MLVRKPSALAASSGVLGAAMLPAATLWAQNADPSSGSDTSSTTTSDAAGGIAGCAGCGFIAVFIVALIAINIALLVWISKDAKARGMDNPILWMLLVFFTGLIGIVVYLLVRPPGPLVRCQNCANKKLITLLRCPQCGYGVA